MANSDKANAALNSDNSKKVPEFIFLMITEPNKTPMIRSLDAYVGNKSDIADIIGQACARWGKENVHFCKVIPTEIKTQVQIDGDF